MANLFGQDIWARRGEAPTTTSSIGMSETPVGVPLPWPAATSPTGWLICDGSAIPAGCPTLSALYGTNLPNLKGRVIVGYDAAQAEFNTLLVAVGSKTVTLTETQMPSHGHTQNGHGHGAAGHNHGGASAGGSHFHLASIGNVKYGDNAAHGHRDRSGFAAEAPTNDIANASPIPVNVDTVADHTHTIPSDADSILDATATNQSTGGGQPHNNLQPSMVFNYIVRAA